MDPFADHSRGATQGRNNPNVGTTYSVYRSRRKQGNTANSVSPNATYNHTPPNQRNMIGAYTDNVTVPGGSRSQAETPVRSEVAARIHSAEQSSSEGGSTRSVDHQEHVRQDRLVEPTTAGSFLETMAKSTFKSVWKGMGSPLIGGVVQTLVPSDTVRYGVLTSRAMESKNRFAKAGAREDIDDAIACFQESIPLSPRNMEWFALNCLALCYGERYKRWENVEDNQMGIDLFRKALLLPLPDKVRPQVFYGLACVLRDQYEEQGRNQDLDEAIQLCRDGLVFPMLDPIRECLLRQITFSLLTRTERQSNPQDVEDAVRYGREAVNLCPPGNIHRASALSDFAGALFTRYTKEGDSQDLEEAIRLNREALLLHPSGHPERSGSLTNLSFFLEARYQKLGSALDLEEAVELNRATLSLHPLGHKNRAKSLNTLGFSLFTQFEMRGLIQDLEEAIHHYREALTLHFPRGMDPSYLLNNLAGGLQQRYQNQGNEQDLKDSIQYYRDALLLQSPGHPGRSLALCNLGLSLQYKYIHQGGIEDLEEAIQFSRDALLLETLGHIHRPVAISNLALSIQLRFREQGDPKDLEKAIALNREALLLHPSGSLHRCKTLINLAVCFQFQFEKQKNVQALEEAIQLCKEALLLLPPGSGGRAITLNVLSTSLLNQYKQQGDPLKLKETIQVNRDALECYPNGHPERPLSLHQLCMCLILQYIKQENAQDLEEALQCTQDAIQISSLDHPILSRLWFQLAMLNLLKGHADGVTRDVTDLCIMGAEHHTASINQRLSACLDWITWATKPSLLLAYQKSLELADRYILIRSSVTSRHQFLSKIPQSLPLDAAATAISANKVEKAVELLEQGRSLLWSQMSRYRTSLDVLEEVDLGLAQEFRRLSDLLETSSTSPISSTAPVMSQEDEARKYRRVSEEWSNIVDKIRKLEGFSDFLLPTPFATLRQASIHGPVIIVNISGRRSDAIIVQSADQPILVPLPQARPDDITHLYSEFTQGIQSSKPSKKILAVLRSLWDDIVEPIVIKLQEINYEHGSRIWWCPTSQLAMLPLHAAGPYRRGKSNLPDIYISSYTLTLSALLRSRNELTSTQSHNPDLLLIAQPEAPGQCAIPSVQQELQIIQDTVPSVQLLAGEHGTREAVLSNLRTHSWVHFTTHGSQNIRDPFSSCLHLHDKPLNLIDIVQARLPDARYAFLAACHSAAGDTDRPDETIHMAAGLQFSGFRSVIGTMYAMADIDGPGLAEDVYKYMFRQRKPGCSKMNDSVMDHRDAAKALNIATKVLRDGGVPVERWINFVHIGA